jgi:hypothetical protein
MTKKESKETIFNATCDGKHGLTYGWIGPNRKSYGEAQTDADNHNTADCNGTVAVVQQP